MKNVLLINDTRNEYHIGSKQVIQNIFDLCEKNNMKIIGTLTRKEIENWIPRINKRLKEADIILINGEGSMHDDPNWFSVLCNNLYKFKDKKIVLFNSVWQNMKLTQPIIEFLDACEIIAFRESYSFNEFRKSYTRCQKAKVIPDVIFYKDYKCKSIGYGDTVLKNKEDFKQNGNYLPMNSVFNCPDIYAYMNWLKTLSLYVTGRFHGVCLAVLSLTPVLAQPSNTHKIGGLLYDMNCLDLLIEDPKNFKINLEAEIRYHDSAINYIMVARERINKLFVKIGKL